MASLDVFVAVRYCSKVMRGRARPRLATWLIFEIGVVMSLAAYFASHDHSVVKAALNLTDGFTVTGIISVLLLRGRGEKVEFTANERVCLLVSCVTLAAWAVTKTAWVGFAGFQAVMTIAYLPTIESMWQWHPGESPEPTDMWVVSVVAASIGVAVDVTGKHDYVALVYPLRALVLCMLIVVLLGRWRWKSWVHAR